MEKLINITLFDSITPFRMRVKQMCCIKFTVLKFIICLLSLLFGGTVDADEPGLILSEARGTAIQLNIEQGQGLILFGRGAFISEEGHALVSLAPVCHGKVPTVLCNGAEK